VYSWGNDSAEIVVARFPAGTRSWDKKLAAKGKKAILWGYTNTYPLL
jgi:hypothetical protein